MSVAVILVVDDDPMIRETMQQILETAGHTVVCAENGSRALHEFKARPPDLVITDIIMPEREGIETILELRRLRPDAPIVAISGASRSGNADYLEMARKFGANAILAKPFEADELVAVVNRVLSTPDTKVEAMSCRQRGTAPRSHLDED